MSDIIDCLSRRIIPVAVLDDVRHGPLLGEALIAGGLPLVEITLRTQAGLAAIATLARDGGPTGSQLLVGAGTVTSTDQVEAAVSAGAKFIVSPGYSAEVVHAAQKLGVTVIPGVATAGEMMAALGQGLRLVKFFPASHLGGPAGLAAFTGVFPELSFVPTGGVGPNNLGDYLSMTSVAAVGGSWMIPREALHHGDGPTIEALTKQAVELAAPYKLSTREDT